VVRSVWICACLVLPFLLHSQDSWRHIKRTQEQLAKQALHIEKGYLYGDSLQNISDSAFNVIHYKKGKVMYEQHFRRLRLVSATFYNRKAHDRKIVHYYNDKKGRVLGPKDIIEYRGFEIKKRSTYYPNGKKSKKFNRGNYKEWNGDGSKRKTRNDTVYVFGTRQNYERSNSKKAYSGKPYLFSMQTMVKGRIISIHHFSKTPGLTKSAWYYDSFGRLSSETDGHLRKTYFYKSDTDRIHAYTITRIRNSYINSDYKEFETIIVKDSLGPCELCSAEVTAKTGIFKVCNETSSSDKKNLVYRLIKYSYDSNLRMVGQGKYEEDNELKSFYTIEFDKKGNICKRTKWSFTGQGEERIDYIYDKRGGIKKAIGYYNNKATDIKESRFIIKYVKQSSNCLQFTSEDL